MLDHTEDTVYTNLAYLLPALPAAMLGPLEFGLVGGASVYLTYGSARYHTTYEREEQGLDVAAMLTYLTALLAALLASWSSWGLLLPVVAAPLHERYVWEIDSHVAVPVYVGGMMVALWLQVGLLQAAPSFLLIAVGAAAQLSTGPRAPLHSIWHVCGGLSASLALMFIL